MLNFVSFMVSLNNLYPPISYTYEKVKSTGDEKGNLLQILNCLDLNVTLNSENEISTNVYYKDTNTHDYLPDGSAHP